ncbi:unnamed protein product [Lactuca virosa]|uniref:Uncharacterized protein n=1 Tax=Lactuca virosa TaxID=75947 RepID=A0AAU9MDW2_9ASTR|nr:unnamed protein product [Lactuca virosa]
MNTTIIPLHRHRRLLKNFNYKFSIYPHSSNPQSPKRKSVTVCIQIFVSKDLMKKLMEAKALAVESDLEIVFGGEANCLKDGIKLQ